MYITKIEYLTVDEPYHPKSNEMTELALCLSSTLVTNQGMSNNKHSYQSDSNYNMIVESSSL